MSHFYASIEGNRRTATRGGSKNSGMQGHIRGWNIGGRVEMFFNENTGKDDIRISITAGSNNPTTLKDFGWWTLKGNRLVKVR